MERKPSPHQIYDTLRNMIVALELAPGSRVTETQLADYFKVSRTPIRAVLQRLESEGLVAVKAKQGCFIRNIDMLQISHYYDVRVVLENLVLEEISRLNNWDDLTELASLWNPQAHCYGLEITDELKLAEEHFHMDLAKISKNKVLENYIADINDHIRVVRRLGWPNSKSVEDTYAEHYRICQLLLHKDYVTAQQEMTNHIRKSQDQASRITLHQLYANKKAVKFE